MDVRLRFQSQAWVAFVTKPAVYNSQDRILQEDSIMKSILLTGGKKRLAEERKAFSLICHIIYFSRLPNIQTARG
jgi:hypothetical protein